MAIFLSGDYVLLTREQVQALLSEPQSSIYTTLVSWLDNNPPPEPLSDQPDEATQYITELLKARQNMEKWYNQIIPSYKMDEPLSSKDQKLWQLLVENYEQIKGQMREKGFVLPKWALEE